MRLNFPYDKLQILLLFIRARVDVQKKSLLKSKIPYFMIGSGSHSAVLHPFVTKIQLNGFHVAL